VTALHVLLACFSMMLQDPASGADAVRRVQPKSQMPKILWHEPARMTPDDWVCGPGGCGRKPEPPFRFIRVETAGTSPKVLVRDRNGRIWSVKLGAKVIPDVFGPRFLMALGYFGEPSYYVAAGKIAGAGRLPAKVRHLLKKDGSFAKVRFELRDEKWFVFLPNSMWDWNSNPFVGTPQLAGLKTAVMLLSAWDDKDARFGQGANTAVFRWADSGRPAEVYSFFDWGSALGRWGSFLRRDQSDCAAFTADTPNFVKRTRDGHIQWGYSGKATEVMKSGITIADIRWLLPYLERITPEDLRIGLTASGATPRQAQCWAYSIGNRIRELENIAR
jgi:hypothetical protein